MFGIQLTSSALEDLKVLRKYDQKQIVAGIDAQLMHEPNVATRNRKQLRPNDLAEWELRVSKFRAFYDVDDVNRMVTVVAVGVKEGNRLLIRGTEYKL